MNEDRDWAEIRPQTGSTMAEAGLGVLRLTLLFGSLAVAVALFAAPILDRTDSSLTASSNYSMLDRRSTGTVGGASTTYTVRRSVLQTGPNSACYIYSNGIQTGDC